MPRIVFDHPVSLRHDFVEGDEVTVKSLSPALQALLTSPRPDGEKVCHIEDSKKSPRQTATASAAGREQATAP